jgi:hypothetical protein
VKIHQHLLLQAELLEIIAKKIMIIVNIINQNFPRTGQMNLIWYQKLIHNRVRKRMKILLPQDKKEKYKYIKFSLKKKIRILIIFNFYNIE